MWAIIDLMGRNQVAGKLGEREGSLIRLDIPCGDGFRTELYGEAAVYCIRYVSEEIARGFVKSPDISFYNTDIVDRKIHENKVSELQDKNRKLEKAVDELQDRLIKIHQPLLESHVGLYPDPAENEIPLYDPAEEIPF